MNVEDKRLRSCAIHLNAELSMALKKALRKSCKVITPKSEVMLEVALQTLRKIEVIPPK